MVKMLIGFSIGATLAGVLLLGPLRPDTLQAEDAGGSSGNLTGMDLTALDVRQLLTSVEGEISTDDTRVYYESLLSRYQVNDFPTPTVESLAADPASLLPDVKLIATSAVTAPLEEAAKRITDPEIKAYYWKLLGDAGWNVSPK